ncbi:ATP-binding protein [Geminisphaera colitermitum]|uniref:ATP-binding protein n=1 Tax=Geminisphaera colitermitum TaxID=1148786 RepID=UPI000158D52C|nr:ATP-binding protein [Geminisphaera colitermitum]
MKNSFARRLTIRVALLVVSTAFLVLVAGGWLLNRQGMRSIEIMQGIEGEELRHLLGELENPTPAQIKHRFENEADSDIALYFVQVRNPHGDVVYRSANLGEAFIPPAPATDRRHWTSQVNGAGAVRVSEFIVGSWRIQVGSPLTPVTRILHSYVGISIALLAVTALLSLGLGHAFSRLTLAPLRDIESAARRISADNLGERIPMPPGHDELASLARLLNQAFDRLETSFGQVRRFSAEASHELKTPLALIRLDAEKLRARLATALAADSESEAMVADLLDETTRMGRIIESLLFIAKAEGGALVLERHSQEMAPFVAGFAEDAAVLAQDRGLQFRIGRVDTGAASIDPHRLRQLLLNLVSNAIVASPPGGVITLDVVRRDNGVGGSGWRLTMTDEGPGLPPEMLEKIFDRFVRYASATSASVSTDADARHRGHGLGLAICRSIAELHGGTIRAENREDRPGLRIVMEW